MTPKEKTIEKVIRDENVAVLVSVDFGAGWYSWNTEHKELLFHPKLVEMVEQGRNEEITEEWVEENLGIKNVYCGGTSTLEIFWIPQGQAFRIGEYDGYESIITAHDLDMTA